MGLWISANSSLLADENGSLDLGRVVWVIHLYLLHLSFKGLIKTKKPNKKLAICVCVYIYSGLRIYCISNLLMGDQSILTWQIFSTCQVLDTNRDRVPAQISLLQTSNISKVLKVGKYVISLGIRQRLICEEWGGG